jgi:hypothetical protein
MTNKEQAKAKAKAKAEADPLRGMTNKKQATATANSVYMSIRPSIPSGAKAPFIWRACGGTKVPPFQSKGLCGGF